MAMVVIALAHQLSTPPDVSAQTSATNGRLLFEAVDGTACLLMCGPNGLSSARDIWTVAPDGTDLVNVTGDPAHDGSAQWSPDGSKIVFSSDRNGDFDIFTVAPDGTALTQLTSGDGDDEHPTWSPNGRRIAFVRGNVRRSYDIFVMRSDGSSLRRIAAVSYAYAFGLHWSPDGRKLVFTKRRSSNIDNGGGEGNDDIYTIRPDGSRLRPLVRTPRDDAYPKWSPNGRWVTFTSVRCRRAGTDEESCNYDIFKARANRLNHVKRLTTSGAYEITSTWSADGTKISYASSSGEPLYLDIFVMNRDGSNKTRVVRRPESVELAPDWQPLTP